MKMDNRYTRAESKKSLRPKTDNSNVIQFPQIPIYINEQLAMVQKAFNLAPCPAVKSCFSAKINNPFSCPFHKECQIHEEILSFFA